MPAQPIIDVISDPDALTKIIGNLLTNALKFTRSKIILTLIPNSDKTYTVTVEDNGRGISDNHKELIFDPFYQVTARRQQGRYRHRAFAGEAFG
jgi:Signal transduction histidine kinase